MFAQTLSMFVCRTVHTPEKEDFTRTRRHTPSKTNPFFQNFSTKSPGRNFLMRCRGVMEEHCELLDHAIWPAVLKDFGKGRAVPTGGAFLRDVLAAYDPKLREVRGVYYTPNRWSVHRAFGCHLLKTRFNRAKSGGENTLILDRPRHATFFILSSNRFTRVCEAKGRVAACEKIC